jgi:hypothetical protein
MRDGARDVTECQRTERASCVRLSRPPSTETSERCFGDARACERYRAFVHRSGHVTSSCEDSPPASMAPENERLYGLPVNRTAVGGR